MSAAAAAEVTRRPETAADAAFRTLLFRDSRQPHESLPGLDPALADQLARHQLAAQEAGYRTAYPEARHEILEVESTPVGRLVVDQGRAAWTIVDIAILGAWRGRGLGTRVLAEVMGAAQAAGAAVRLNVMAHNAGAARLYARLGFAVEAATEVEVAMVWTPPTDGETGLPDRLRLPLAFDADAMAADLARLEADAWIPHFVPQNYDGDWSVIPLRAKAGATHPVMMMVSDPGCGDYVDTPVLDLCPAIRAALSAFPCPLQAVRLMRLGPGSIIKEHSDGDLDAALGCARLHVPIATSEDIDFRLNGRRVVMAPGETWYLRLADPHSVANRGRSARVHLVIDALVDGWLAGLLAAAASGGHPGASEARARDP